MIYEIAEQNFLPLTKKLDRLNQKLTRIGAPAVTYVNTGFRDEADEKEPAKIHRYILLDVTGAAPQFNGWHFLATIVHTQEGNIIRSVPGFQAPSDYRDRAQVCDHCKQKRQRHDTYIVQHDDGRTMQVGSTCMRDFLATEPGKLTNAAQILFNAFSICESAKDRHWLGGSTGYEPHRIDLDTFLKTVAAVVLKEGKYITRSAARNKQCDSTADIALAHMLRGYYHEQYPLTPEAEKLATDARNYVLRIYSPALADDDCSIDQLKGYVLNALVNVNKELSDFEHNLLSCARADAIEPRLAGISAYIIEVFRRHQAATSPKPAVTALNKEGLKRIFDMFTLAAKHLKNPSIRLADENDLKLHLSLAGAASKNAGCIYVKQSKQFGSPYYGKITPTGEFMPVASAPATIQTCLQAFANDPETLAAKYGKLTGTCCFCGLSLKDERSTDVGYGPICAKKFGLNWGSTVRTPEVPEPQAQVA